MGRDEEKRLAEAMERAHAALRRQWEREAPEPEPEHAYMVEFVSTRGVAERIKQFVAEQPTRRRRFRVSSEPVGERRP